MPTMRAVQHLQHRPFRAIQLAAREWILACASWSVSFSLLLLSFSWPTLARVYVADAKAAFHVIRVANPAH